MGDDALCLVAQQPARPPRRSRRVPMPDPPPDMGRASPMRWVPIVTNREPSSRAPPTPALPWRQACLTERWERWSIASIRAAPSRSRGAVLIPAPRRSPLVPPPLDGLSSRKGAVGAGSASAVSSRRRIAASRHRGGRAPGAGRFAGHARAPCSRSTGRPTRQVPSRNRFGNGRNPGSFLRGAAPARWRAALRRVGDDPAQYFWGGRRRIR